MLLKPDSCIGCLFSCPPYGSMEGYVPANGPGSNGCLVVLEAAGADEAVAGIPTVGAAGQYLWNQLHRVGIERDGFRVHNVLSCRPPNNKLSKMPYEASVIASCAPLLDATITEHALHCKTLGKISVIIALGKIAFRRIMGVSDRDAIMKESYIGYPIWSERYGSWVISAYHPSHLMQGKQHLTPILCYVFERALEIASNSITLDKVSYLEDPEPATFEDWVQGYFHNADHNPELILSYDIETPYKAGKDEADLAREDDEGVVLRCSFSYRVGEAVSIPWTASYYPTLQEIFAYDGAKVGWNNSQFDAPKIKEYWPINGDDIDAMLAWHVLNSSFPKGLGFVTPFYAQKMSMWKHLSKERPAFYNACDADAALRCWLGIREDLKRNNLWNVFNRHVTEVHRVYKFMSDQGLRLDQQLRREAEIKLSGMLDIIEAEMALAIPLEARRIDKVYKREPADKTGLYSRPGTRIERFCTKCDASNPKKDHLKRYKKKINPCVGGFIVTRSVSVMEWYRLRDWKLSKDQLSNYQRVVKHKPIWNRRERKTTFDESAIMRLMALYPKDKLYPLILERREKEKLLFTYIGVTQPDGKIKGGMSIGVDGKIHCTLTSNPNTLRSACQDPNLQNLPRPTSELSSIIRNLIIASPGNILYARDFAGIEAVLVGYDAGAPGYIKLARRDVHTYYTAWALNELEPGRIPANDLPLLSWSDEKLFSHLEGLKVLVKKERNSLYKHLVHAANFMQSASGAKKKIYAETGQDFEVSRVKRVMDIYFELFPEIRRWHYSVLSQAEKDGYIRNAFGYLGRFSHVFNYEKVDGKWDKRPNPDVANKVVAFSPQSNAAGIIKMAILALRDEYFEEVCQYLRLLVHDELLFDVPEQHVDNVDRICQMVMERPIPEFRMPDSYGLGPHLSILTEPKRGPSWARMK